MDIKLKVVKIEKETDDQVIIGQGNFSIYTTDNIFRELLTTVPRIKCAIAMNEADPKLVRFNHNDDRLGDLAAKNALAIGASHVFVIVMQGAYPINVLPTIRNVPGVCNIYVASANPLEVIIAETSLGRAVVGVVDGQAVNSIENDEKRQARRDLVKKIGYKLG
ncbi:MAG: adenosine-specific kinase [Candidatus Helarchaeota archaeon]|nr:adenosine-specific kinase [Candidatus Helarchaeota archaeon]